MAFDFKKEYKEFYMPKNKPEIVTVPKANYIAVRGKGDPNKEGGEYQQAISVLYAVAYTLKMSYKTDYKIEGFFEYVVPPLEGFWRQDDMDGIDYTNKSSFNWISVIRLPDFITQKDFEWAVETATKKKKLDCSSAEFMTIDEGLCIQIMHFGSFDDEPATVALMDEYLDKNGYVNDITDTRLHHEIYLSDARRVAPEKWKTVIRHPIKKIETTSSLQKKENLMKRILVVLGGGRPKGNTRQLADAFIQGAVDAGHEVELISLNRVEVKGCMGCIMPVGMENHVYRKTAFLNLSLK